MLKVVVIFENLTVCAIWLTLVYANNYILSDLLETSSILSSRPGDRSS